MGYYKAVLGQRLVPTLALSRDSQSHYLLPHLYDRALPFSPNSWQRHQSPVLRIVFRSEAIYIDCTDNFSRPSLSPSVRPSINLFEIIWSLGLKIGPYWKCKCPMNLHSRLLVAWLVRRSICHNFFKRH